MIYIKNEILKRVQQILFQSTVLNCDCRNGIYVVSIMLFNHVSLRMVYASSLEPTHS